MLMVGILLHGNLPLNCLSIKLSKFPPLPEIKRFEAIISRGPLAEKLEDFLPPVFGLPGFDSPGADNIFATYCTCTFVRPLGDVIVYKICDCTRPSRKLPISGQNQTH